MEWGFGSRLCGASLIGWPMGWMEVVTMVLAFILQVLRGIRSKGRKVGLCYRVWLRVEDQVTGSRSIQQLTGQDKAGFSF